MFTFSSLHYFNLFSSVPSYSKAAMAKDSRKNASVKETVWSGLDIAEVTGGGEKNH
jgi:hypothetical protein